MGIRIRRLDGFVRTLYMQVGVLGPEMGGSTTGPRGSRERGDARSDRAATVVVALFVATSLLVGLPLAGSVVATGEFADFTGTESEWFLDGKDASFADGDLELTRSNPNREGVGFYDRSLSHEDRYLVEFTYVAEHDRKEDEDSRGEGVLLFAVDGSQVHGEDLSGYRVKRGAESDLGYYEENVPHAYLGVGFDRSGPFSTHWYDEDEPNEPFPHSVTIRGGEEVHPAADLGEGPEAIYEFVERTRVRDRHGERVDTNGEGTAAIDVRVLVEPDDAASLVTVEMRWDRGGEWVRVHDRVRYDRDAPEELKFGVAAATGPEGQDAGYNEHVIRSMELTEGHTVDGAVTLDEEPVDRPLEVELTATNGSTTWTETVVIPAGETTVDYRIDGLPSDDYRVTASVEDDGFVVAEDGRAVSTERGVFVEGVDFTLVETPPIFDVAVLDHAESVTEGETVTVDVDVTNTGGQNGTQEVRLLDVDGQVVDATELTLEAGDSETVTLSWVTDDGDAGAAELAVHSDDTSDSTGVIRVEESDAGSSDDDGRGDGVTTDDEDDGSGDEGADGVEDDDDAADDTDESGASTGSIGEEDGRSDSDATGDDGSDDDDGARDAGDDGSGDDDRTTGEAAISVAGGSLSDDTVTVGEPVTVRVVVENTGDDTVAAVVPVTVDGETEHTAEVGLEPGETGTITTTLTFDEPGEYTIGADGEEIGTVTVGPTREAGALVPVRVLLAAGVLLVLLLLAARMLPAPGDEPGAPGA